MFTLTPLRPSARRAFFGARSPMDMLFWGPEFNGYAFLGPGVQWICFFGIPENQGICHWICFFGARSPMDMFFWGPEFNQYAFFGARSPMDMLFWDTRKPRDLPLDMLFWGPESHGYAFLGPGVHWICFFVIPENQGICHWICFFGARSPIFCIYLYQATTCKSVK